VIGKRRRAIRRPQSRRAPARLYRAEVRGPAIRD
jgi:hypothetical protein